MSDILNPTIFTQRAVWDPPDAAPQAIGWRGGSGSSRVTPPDLARRGHPPGGRDRPVVPLGVRPA
ncbi:hypothetical protein CHELA20_53097 [Hyphomicrobiales bacterium]|nr:hypothetical protein CHELA41_21828 [Hyphomicrobiales bacterium]CAH1683568.1 hypothetical protein CHELA20_53097 [Hyphomicrobiales bacterium]